MYQIDFHNPCNVYFCGIGGISMSGLAQVLLDASFKVSGSDMKQSELTDELSLLGAKIYIGQKADNLSADIDLFVYTAAIHPDHPEFSRAQELGISMLTRAELLGQIMKNYPMSIAVSGTHGKTTVTSMLSDILMADEADPTLSIGGILESIGGNFRIGHSDIFVTEACEYTNSFLSFFPKASLILNVEEDHLDFFKDIHDIRSSFNKFARLNPSDGIVVINGDMDGLDVVTKDVTAKIVTFGRDSSSMYYPSNIHTDADGNSVFTLNSPNHAPEEFILAVPGSHNIMNAVATVAMTDYLNVDREIAKKALKTFRGSKRRFEFKGNYNGFTVIDDYAHHPSEIRATLTAAKQKPHSKLWVCFQPHTYTRTKAFLDEFADALALADAVILADIYAAREKDTLGISSDDIAQRVKAKNCECYYIPTFDEIKKFVKNNCAPGDMFITMGAGDVVNIGEELLRE